LARLLRHGDSETRVPASRTGLSRSCSVSANDVGLLKLLETMPPESASNRAKSTTHMPERDAWLLRMTGALDEMVSDEALRAELLSAFAKLADWMRNDPGNPHDRQQHV
jgi:hypothetical protein